MAKRYTGKKGAKINDSRRRSSVIAVDINRTVAIKKERKGWQNFLRER